MKNNKEIIIVAIITMGVAAYGGEEALLASRNVPAPIVENITNQAVNEDDGLFILTYGSEFHSLPKLVIDNFQGNEVKNQLGGRANIYVQNPSRVMVSRSSIIVESNTPSTVLMLMYEKNKEGGPYGGGGWCGYYTLLKQIRNGEEDIYFDALPFETITFKVKGESGQENFVVGLADRHWDKVGDALKSLQIGQYLESGHITTNWQTAKIPLDEFFLDRTKLSSISFGFESTCFPDGSGTGTVYIDDLALEK